MRIFPTGFWPALINHAIIIGQEKRTGMAFEYKIIILILDNILVQKVTRFQFQMFCKPVNVFFIQPWTNSLAAIGTIETIKTGKCLIMQLMHNIIKVPGLLLLYLFNKGYSFSL